VEPVEKNEAALGLDYNSWGPRQKAVKKCIEEGREALTDRLKLVIETEEDSYGVILMHPGVRISDDPGVWPKDLASIVIRIPDLIKRSTENQQQNSAVYIFDTSDFKEAPVFLGAASVTTSDNESGPLLTPLSEVSLTELQRTQVLYMERIIRAADRRWIVSVLTIDDTYKPGVLFVCVGGIIIFLASLCLALFICARTRRVEERNKLKAVADVEKAKMILKNAHEATRAERELNDFLGHEVRNPVAAAMTACSFVKAAVFENEPLATEESCSTTRQDIAIIENAMKFVNDLLRNMLDMHRAATQQLKVTMEPTDLFLDVLEPVHSMLNQRNANFLVDLDCPRQLLVVTDRLRLKQVVLNLGRNSLKFVESGYVRLRAQVAEGMVELSIEDSGPGIPPEKRGSLFNKFQESLDSLSQGTVGAHSSQATAFYYI
jgi:signal transduction histidine kinase